MIGQMQSKELISNMTDPTPQQQNKYFKSELKICEKEFKSMVQSLPQCYESSILKPVAAAAWPASYGS